MLFPKLGKYIIIFFAIAFILVAIRGYQLYQYVFRENVKKDYVLIIPENATYKQVTDSLGVNEVLESIKAFKWVSKKKKYISTVKPGRYEFTTGMNTNQVVNILRSGLQTPIKVTFNNVRFNEELAAKVSKYIQADSISILNLFSDEKQIEKYGFTPETYRTMFIPDTYEFYWTTSAEEFAERMKIEYDRFWNEERQKKAEAMNLTPVEVSVLASIVQSETAKKEELQRVAGLYYNRIKKGIPLQADPTVKYAVGDFSLKRILNSHLAIESPYNTYKYAGLPPGPINFPETTTIDAVLNFEEHNYIYMCAREDFSGYHYFATTLAEHNRNAAKYRAALDAERIYK
ncbi:MAG: endolytic transglycosylase MltG [Prolixibacteraceae bacterium]|nr:endolytic transglycosylase MltG [Prolixibacteraceae bacterium]